MPESELRAGSILPHRQTDPLDGTPYRAVGPLGFGGMGEVLEAEHRALRKRVVAKLLREGLASEPRLVDRIRLEAQALGALSHPNIVTVTDLGQTPTGRPYLVMERLHGRTLREELTKHGVIPVPRAIEIVRQVLDALEAAHRLGIVHRDVKPDNIFVCEPVGRLPSVVKLLDFGIVKVLATDGAPSSIPGPVCPTEEGMVVGTPRWLAPEQLKFRKVDARADIFGAGLVLYHLVAGRGPYADLKGHLELLDAQLNVEPAPPSRYAPQDIPPELDAAILTALAKNPDQRFQSAEGFALVLARIAAALVPSARSALLREGGAGVGSQAPRDLGDPGPTLLSGLVGARASGGEIAARAAPVADDRETVRVALHATPQAPRQDGAEERVVEAEHVGVCAPGREIATRAAPVADDRATARVALRVAPQAPQQDGAGARMVEVEQAAHLDVLPAVAVSRQTRAVALLTMLSALFFSVVIALLFRYFGVH
jgi:serine/threonine-protein kinase